MTPSFDRLSSTSPRAGPRIAIGIAALAMLAFLLAIDHPARAAAPEIGPVRTLEGRVWIGANDLARLLSATKFWRSDVRKLSLRAGDHRLLFTVGNPFVLIDDRTVLLPADVRTLRGELQIPIELLASLPSDTTLARLYYDARRGYVLEIPQSGLVGSPRLAIEGETTRLAFEADQSEEATVIGRSRAHFLVHWNGVFVGALPDSLPAASLVRAIRQVAAVAGTTLELEIAPEARGFRLQRGPVANQVTLEFTRVVRGETEWFAPEQSLGKRRLKVVALDPGHGGTDLGVTSGTAVEKDLALALARLLRLEIARRLGARVVLTRDDDRSTTLDQRSERVNRARADLVISLHFDGMSSPAGRGATAYCAPAIYGSESGPGTPGGAIEVLPWRDAATRHAVASRELAMRVLAAIDLRVPGPTRLREILPYPLLGVDAPGILLECATLTSAADRARVTSDAGLADLATAIVDGLEAFQASR